MYVLGKGEPLIMLHGLGQTKDAWEPQHELAEHFQLITPDLRGHGESTVTEGINLDNFAKDIIALMDRLEIGQAHIAGISMGGVVAQEIYRQAKDRVKSLILTNTTSYIPYFMGGPELKRRAKALEKCTDEEYIRDTVDRCLYNKSVKEQAYKSFKINRKTYLDAAKTCASVNYLGMLPGVKTPIQIIAGRYDEVTPSACADITFGLSPISRLVNLETGHLSPIESPNEFNRAVSNFIREVSCVCR